MKSANPVDFDRRYSHLYRYHALFGDACRDDPGPGPDGGGPSRGDLEACSE